MQQRHLLNAAVAVVAGTTLSLVGVVGTRMAVASRQSTPSPILNSPTPQWHDGYNHYLVTLSGSTAADVSKLSAAAGVNYVEPVAGNVYSVTGTLSQSQAALLPGVTAIQQNHLYSVASTTVPAVSPTNDTSFTSAYYLQNTGQSINGWPSRPGASADAAAAWRYSMGAGVVIADIDTGVDTSNPDLAGSISPLSYDFLNNDTSVNPIGTATDYNHGTIVDGVMVAHAGNGTGAAGIAPDAQVMALKCSDSASISESCIVQAIYYAVAHGARIINLSLGYEGSFTYGDPLLQAAIQNAANAGVLVVCAAGNWMNNNDTTPVYPASLNLPNMISVAASDNTDNLAGFSDYGANSVDLSAPGEFIYTTEPGGGYGWENGTSLAAPMVSATAALIWSADPSLTYAQVKNDILSTVDHPAALAGKTRTGGRLDAYAALAAVRSGSSVSFSGFNSITSGTASTVKVTTQVTDPSIIPSATPLALRTVLATQYNGGTYAVVNHKFNWTYDGASGTAVTAGNGAAVLDPVDGIGADLTSSGASFSFPVNLPPGNYALLASLVNPASPDVTIGSRQAVFFTVAAPPAKSGSGTSGSGAPSGSTGPGGGGGGGAPGGGGGGAPGGAVSAPASPGSGNTGSRTTGGGSTGTAPNAGAGSTGAGNGSGGTAPSTGSGSGSGSPATGSGTPGSGSGAPGGSSAPGGSGSDPNPGRIGGGAAITVKVGPGSSGGGSGNGSSGSASNPGGTSSQSPTPPSSPSAQFGISIITPSQITTAGGHIDVYGTALPANPAVQVGNSYEPVDTALSGNGHIDVSVGTLTPGTYPLTVWNASLTVHDLVPNAIRVVSDTVTPPGGTGTTSPGANPGSNNPNNPNSPGAPVGSGGSSSPSGPAAGGTTVGGPSLGGPNLGSPSSPSTPIGSSRSSSPSGPAAGSPNLGSPSSPSNPVGSGAAPGSSPGSTGAPMIFTAPDGLQLSKMQSGGDFSSISVGTWGTFTCRSASCPGVFV